MNCNPDHDSGWVVDKQILSNPPPNHNPLIGMLHVDTLQNTYDALSVLELVITELEDEGFPSSADVDGYYCLMRCIRNAIKFEIEYRPSGQLKQRPEE